MTCYTCQGAKELNCKEIIPGIMDKIIYLECFIYGNVETMELLSSHCVENQVKLHVNTQLKTSQLFKIISPEKFREKGRLL